MMYNQEISHPGEGRQPTDELDSFTDLELEHETTNAKGEYSTLDTLDCEEIFDNFEAFSSGRFELHLDQDGGFSTVRALPW